MEMSGKASPMPLQLQIVLLCTLYYVLHHQVRPERAGCNWLATARDSFEASIDSIRYLSKWATIAGLRDAVTAVG